MQYAAFLSSSCVQPKIGVRPSLAPPHCMDVGSGKSSYMHSNALFSISSHLKKNCISIACSLYSSSLSGFPVVSGFLVIYSTICWHNLFTSSIGARLLNPNTLARYLSAMIALHCCTANSVFESSFSLTISHFA